MLFSELAEKFMNQYSRPFKKSWKEDERRLKLYLLPALANLEIQNVTRGHIAELHGQIGLTKPYAANRVRELVHTMFEKAIEWEYLPETHRNPAKKIKDFPEKSRTRFLNEAEVIRLMKSLAYEPNASVKAAIILFLLTGLRVSEVTGLKWSYIQGDYFIIPNSKNGDPIYHPISEPIRYILSTLPYVIGSDYILAGLKPNKALHTSMRRAWERIVKRACVTNIQKHDLRRTCGSWLTQSGVGLRVVQECLNHRDMKSTLVYARLNLKDKAEALEGYTSKVFRLLEASGLNLVPVRDLEIAGKVDEVQDLSIIVPENKIRKISRLTPDRQIVIEARIIRTLQRGYNTKAKMYSCIGTYKGFDKLELERVLQELIKREIVYEYREAPHWHFRRFGLAKDMHKVVDKSRKGLVKFEKEFDYAK